ncbi:IS66 family insertion sequence element accessory protein TnpB [Edaphobacter aggregans]|uniref:IS66 family insertion sequence element accessory protein TnpB n=1 Tax=Edaphobacter aggregans TaxID=570835 RepID=UPI0014706DFF
MRVLVAIEPVDGRKGIDSLVRVCQGQLCEDPMTGCVFVFRSRRGTSIRLLSYDGQGYWLAQKRLSRGGSHVAGVDLGGQAVGGLRGPAADGGRGCVASACSADVATSKRTEIRIKKVINTPCVPRRVGSILLGNGRAQISRA